MAFKRKSLIWLFIIAIIIILIAIVIYIFRCDIFKNLTSCVADPNESGIPVPPGSSTSKWVPETFPLNIGMYGPKIKALQKSLGFQDVDKNAPNYQDGRFGSVETRPAVIAKGYAVPLSEADYNTILSNSIGGGIAGKSARAKSDITAVYINDSATNPTFLKYVKKDEEAGIVKSSDTTWYYLEGFNTKVAKNQVYLA